MSLEDAWWGHLQQVRWFGGKGAAGEVIGLEPLPWYTQTDAVPAIRSEIARIAYADGREETYHLLSAHYPAGASPVAALASLDGVDVVDATTDPDAVRGLVAALQGASGGGMTWTHRLPDAGALDVRVWTGEQSNSTITLGDAALLKLFRRIEPGPNLDAEVLDALDGSGCSVPALFGRLVGAWPAGATTDLGIVMERVRDARDGWEIATAACASEQDFADPARALGRELAGVHAALRSTFPTDTAAGDDLADTMLARLDAAAIAAPVLVPHRDTLATAFEALRGQTLPVQRVHGDFHLGQTLRSPDAAAPTTGRWTIIDFEGEPAKTAAERRASDSVWRDVAGMLRSFDYARSAHPEPESAGPRNWARQARTAFCEGYCGAAEVPWALLSAYETDKAVYEVVYETRNRPDWVSIPLRALTDLVASASGRASTN